jgi:RNA polymerase sigma factor (sigma-70 family)
MATPPLGSVVRHLRRSLNGHGRAALTDDALLERFVRGRDEAAFEALLHRHAPMVFGVCRRVLGNDADAEDAFQATFLVLVRKAGTIRPRGLVGNWLYGVARNTALKAKAMIERRRVREKSAAPPGQSGGPRDDELHLLVDEELQALPDKYRAAIVLCDLEGKSLKEAGALTRAPAATVGTRLARGRRLLAERLARRGVTLSGAALAGVVAGGAASAVPPALVASTLEAAGAVAAGQAAGVVSANVAALTAGVLNTMLLSKLKFATGMVLVLALVAGMVLMGRALGGAASGGKEGAARGANAAGKNPDMPRPLPSDAKRLEGVWLAESAEQRGKSALSYVWTSKLTVTGDRFALAHFMGLSKDLVGSFTLDESASPKMVNLKVEEYDLAAGGAPMPLKIPACTLPGIWKLEGDRLTVCFTSEAGAERPTAFDGSKEGVNLVTLRKAPVGFKDLPKEVTVKVTGPGGEPAAGVTVGGFMSLRENREKKGAPSDWHYYDAVKTVADGTAKVRYEKLRFSPLLARDAAKKQMVIEAISPASLTFGEVRVALKPECRVTGSIVCEELTKLGKKVGWTNVYLMHGGQRVADCDSPEGKFEFPVPPGTYTLHAYGTDLGAKDVTVTVPAGRQEVTVDPIPLEASKLLLMQGKPAPELTGVVGWSGKEVKLADLRGKYVLLEFWGYWCGPCVQSMPVLIELHERFADRGLAVVGVHMDTGGDVDSAAKLEEKIAGFPKKLWSGKGLAFPNALVSAKRGERERNAVAQYGIRSWPTTVLIDPEGKVVGRFHARDVKDACAAVEKLLGARK